MRIETKHLIIRGFTEEDLQHAYNYLSNESTMYYISDVYSMERASNFITKYGMGDSPYIYAIEEKNCNHVIGHVIFHEADCEEIYEIGCVLHTHFQGKGYGKESIKAVLEYGFHQLKLHKIMAETIQGNDKCVRLLDKLNFTLEGTLRNHNFDHDTWVDEYYYGIFPHEFIS